MWYVNHICAIRRINDGTRDYGWLNLCTKMHPRSRFACTSSIVSPSLHWKEKPWWAKLSRRKTLVGQTLVKKNLGEDKHWWRNTLVKQNLGEEKPGWAKLWWYTLWLREFGYQTLLNRQTYFPASEEKPGGGKHRWRNPLMKENFVEGKSWWTWLWWILWFVVTKVIPFRVIRWD